MVTLYHYLRIFYSGLVLAVTDELQEDLDEWMEDYNKNRTHQGKYCYGKTPYQTYLDSIELAKEKYLDNPTRECELKQDAIRIDFPEKTPQRERGVFGEEINSTRRNIRYN